MILSDQIVELVEKCDQNDEKDMANTTRMIILFCLESLRAETMQGLKNNLERTLNMYALACKILEKKNIMILKKDGLKKIIAKDIPDAKQLAPHLFKD